MRVPTIRPRRLRVSQNIRRMVQETVLHPADFIYPLFVIPGEQVAEAIPSMPGICRFSVDKVVAEAKKADSLGIPAVLVFGLPTYKDEQGSSAWDAESPVQQAVRAIKQELPSLTVITDVCLCQYTSHGHCGMLHGDTVDNDSTLPLLAKVALSHAEAGADIVAPSDMMDGRIDAIRQLLDEQGFSHVSIMSYAVKYASAFYGPFRDAADSAPQFGDRRSYQMDPANAREALREAALDVEEGADILMVKPALAYLDIVRQVRDSFALPVCAYNVSGEYAMVKAAAANGWIEERRTVLETLLSMKRAGADMIITYHALEAATWLQEK